MAHIGIDCRFASESVGLGTYTRQMVKNLLEQSSRDSFVLFVRDCREEWIKDIKTTNFELVVANMRHYSIAEQMRFPVLIRSSKIDLLYAPHFNVPYFCPVPFVVTIHDLILHRYPNSASAVKRLAYRILMGRSVQKSKKIVAVSKFTAQELSSVYGKSIDAKVIHVTEGYDESYVTNTDQDILDFYDLKPGYFLYVGAAKQHKNVQMLLDSYKKSKIDIPLILVTNGKEVDRLQVPDGARVLLGIEHEELPTIYSAAGCFVTASAYEGFCLPILEARACGCPIIAVSSSAIPEVSGSSAKLIDLSEQSIVEALRNPPNKSDPPESTYSWEASAKKVSGILTDTLHG